MAEQLGERTEQPTGRKLGEARKRGQVAKSQDLGSAIDLVGAAILLALFGSTVAGMLKVLMERVLSGATPGGLVGTDSIAPMVLYAAVESAKVIVPIMLLTMAVGIAAQVMQVGVLFSSQALEPKLDRLDPIKGLKRIFSKRSLMKTLINSLKLVVVVAIATLIMSRHLPRMQGLPALSLTQGLPVIGGMILELLFWLLLLLLALAIVDLIYQRWQHTQDLKMTKQEVKDERRSMDGDPETRARRQRMAQDVAMQRIQSAVPEADVVVTNPTHFSVAIRYDAESMTAPKVTAKGGDYLAMRIRHLAAAHGVPIVERPPLARALYWNVEVGQEVHPEHYEAVAEVLAYVYRLEGRAQATPA